MPSYHWWGSRYLPVWAFWRWRQWEAQHHSLGYWRNVASKDPPEPWHSHLRRVDEVAVGLLTIGFHQVLKLFHGAGQAGIHFEHDPEFCYPIPTRREEERVLRSGPHSWADSQRNLSLQKSTQKTEQDLSCSKRSRGRGLQGGNMAMHGFRVAVWTI